MNNPKVSVVVPVYNVEEYINRCVDSILAQEYENMEIILVDDGATDNSGKICDDYALKFSGIKVVHKENGGLSDARNAGIEVSSGDYVCFVDSDDFIEKEMICELVRLILKTDADIACCGICDCYAGHQVIKTDRTEEFVYDSVEAFKNILAGESIAGSICNKLISKKILGNHRFIKGKIYEDAFFMPELLLNSNKVVVTTRPLYNYWHRQDSITTKPFSEKHMDIIEAYRYTYEVVENQCADLLLVAQFRVLWAYFTVLDKLIFTKDYKKIPQYNEVVGYLKKNWKKVFSNPYFQKGRRIAALALKVNVNLYRVMAKIKYKRDICN